MNRQTVQWLSPSGSLRVRCRSEERGNGEDVLAYEVDYRNKTVLMSSGLGLELECGSLPGERFDWTVAGESSHRSEWRPVCGERSVIRNHYNEAVVELRQRDEPGLRLRIVFRLYDEGFAFRYELPEQERLHRFVIRRERSEFRLPDGCFVYDEYDSEGEYGFVPVSRVRERCWWPLTIRYADGLWGCLTEAGLADYALMRLSPKADGALESDLWGEVEGAAPFASPWRAFIVGESPGELLERNDLVPNLNEA